MSGASRGTITTEPCGCGGVIVRRPGSGRPKTKCVECEHQAVRARAAALKRRAYHARKSGARGDKDGQS